MEGSQLDLEVGVVLLSTSIKELSLDECTVRRSLPLWIAQCG